MYKLSIHRSGLLPALLASALLLGCGDDDGDDDTNNNDGGGQDAGRLDGGSDGGAGIDAATDGGSIDARVSDAAVLSDNQIVEVLRLVNSAEIESGRTADMKAINSQVDSFAQAMVMMHMAAEARRTALNISTATSSVSMTLMAAAATAKAELDSLPAGRAFDVRYIESQVAMHQMALNTIVNVLVPSATAAALRSELATVQSEVMMHLTMATQIRTALGDAGVPDAGTPDGGSADASGIDSGR